MTWMTFGSGFTLLIKWLNRFQKLAGEGWSQVASSPTPRCEGASQDALRGHGAPAGAASSPPASQLPPAHWIMSSSFSTLAKVATLFLSKYRCPGPPCERPQLANGAAHRCPTTAALNTCRCRRACPGRWHPPPPTPGQEGLSPTWQKISIFQILAPLW